MKLLMMWLRTMNFKLSNLLITVLPQKRCWETINWHRPQISEALSVMILRSRREIHSSAITQRQLHSLLLICDISSVMNLAKSWLHWKLWSFVHICPGKWNEIK
jgi:uncharacterized membrane protein